MPFVKRFHFAQRWLQSQPPPGTDRSPPASLAASCRPLQFISSLVVPQLPAHTTLASSMCQQLCTMWVKMSKRTKKEECGIVAPAAAHKKQFHSYPSMLSKLKFITLMRTQSTS